jgi:phage antirepressor YoqD-like protein
MIEGTPNINCYMCDEHIRFNKQEAAKILRVGVKTLDSWMYTNKISFIKRGRKVFFAPQDLRDMEIRHEKETN